jgi:stage V sporulation protein AB
MSLLHDALVCMIGLAGGVAVGTGFVAFIAVLDIIPRLVHLTRTKGWIHHYEMAVLLGVLFFTWIDFRGWVFHLPIWWMGGMGLLMGIFVGMLAAALTEVINVIPILAKRLNMDVHLVHLLMAMALGKVAGSLIQWLWF